MRAPTKKFVTSLPSRKRNALIMLFVVICGGVIAGGGAALA